MERRNIDVISMKKETIKDVHTGNIVASIEEIKEIYYEQAAAELYMPMVTFMEKVLRKNVWKVEVPDQSRSVIGIDQILEANEENTKQIDREPDLEGQISV